MIKPHIFKDGDFWHVQEGDGCLWWFSSLPEVLKFTFWLTNLAVLLSKEVKD